MYKTLFLALCFKGSFNYILFVLKIFNVHNIKEIVILKVCQSGRQACTKLWWANTLGLHLTFILFFGGGGSIWSQTMNYDLRFIDRNGTHMSSYVNYRTFTHKINIIWQS